MTLTILSYAITEYLDKVFRSFLKYEWLFIQVSHILSWTILMKENERRQYYENIACCQNNTTTQYSKDYDMKNGYLAGKTSTQWQKFTKTLHKHKSYIHTNFWMVVTSFFKKTEKKTIKKSTPAHLLRLT